MDKLIKLLNDEYNHFNSDLIYYGWDEECEKFYFHTELPEKTKKELGNALIGDGINEQRVGNEWICSKQFGFIKWLVDNDKVDLKKANNIDNGPLFDFYYDRDALIMALSINDEPIKFLISILK